VKLRNQTRWASSDEEADIVGLPSSGPKQSMPYGGGSAGVGMNDTLRSDSVALSKIKTLTSTVGMRPLRPARPSS